MGGLMLAEHQMLGRHEKSGLWKHAWCSIAVASQHQSSKAVRDLCYNRSRRQGSGCQRRCRVLVWCGPGGGGRKRFSHGEAAEHCGNGNVIRHRSSWSVVVPLAVVPWMVIGQSCVSAPMEICSEGSIGDMLGRLRKHSRKKEERTQAAMCEGHVQDICSEGSGSRAKICSEDSGSRNFSQNVYRNM